MQSRWGVPVSWEGCTRVPEVHGDGARAGGPADTRGEPGNLKWAPPGLTEAPEAEIWTQQSPMMMPVCLGGFLRRKGARRASRGWSDPSESLYKQFQLSALVVAVHRVSRQTTTSSQAKELRN